MIRMGNHEDLEHGGCPKEKGRHDGRARRLPDRMEYRPVMRAALLGVHSGDAAKCWVSFTPPLANASRLGVLGEKNRVLHDHFENAAFSAVFHRETPLLGY